MRDALAPRLRRVRQDPEEPRLEGRPALEATDAVEHADPRVLDDLLRDGARANEEHRDPEHRRTVALDELHERPSSPPERRHQTHIVDGGDVPLLDARFHRVSVQPLARPV